MKFAGWMLSVILIAGTIFAQQGPRRGAAGERALTLQGLKDYLKLSDDQIASLKTVETQMREALKPLVQNMRTKTRALREESWKSTPNADVVAQLKEEIAGLRDQLQTQRSSFQNQLQAILNADQLASLANLEQALRLFPVARAAAAIDLIDSPEGAGIGRLGPEEAAGGARMMRRSRPGN
jgi:Spy/CpxP family protein refolding chaperone